MHEFEAQVAESLKAISKHAEQITIGSFSVWHWTSVTPSFRFDTVARLFPASRRLVVLRARSSFDPDLAAYLLSHATEDWLRRRPLETVSLDPRFDFASRRYDGVGVAPPAVAKCFQSQSPFLAEHSFWVFPVMKDDFRGDEDCEEFHFRLGKGGRIALVDWKRDFVEARGDS